MKWHEVVVHKNVLSYRTVARWIKVFREGRDSVQDNIHKGRNYVGNNIVQLLASLLDADRRWTARELTAEVGVCHKTSSTFCTTFSITANLQRLGYPMRVQQWHRFAVSHALGGDFLGRIVAVDETWARSYEPNLKRKSNEWKHSDSPRPKKVRPTLEGDVHCGICH